MIPLLEPLAEMLGVPPCQESEPVIESGDSEVGELDMMPLLIENALA